ncbi:MAG: ABC-2 type transport system permease protein [Flavobacteriales bacterium]|jgi:ABC-2 type transport system permease protein
MFYNNLIYEIKFLIRSNWLLVLLISITLLFAYSTFNGKSNVTKRLNDIADVKKDYYKKDSLMLATLIKIEKGEKTNIPYWQLPSEPMTVGRRHPRLAIMQPETLSFLATGQSDMYTHFKSPTVYGNNFALDYSEMVNPVQLLFGNFDLAFVIIYILPLLIIAFTFNVLSKEKELGTLRLLGAQPISIISWLLQKMTIRYLVFTISTLLILSITIIIFSSNAYSDFGNLLSLFLLIAGYIFFWFVIACIVNIKINDSSKNALTLIGFWLLIVMVLPATINQIGNSLYPTPSRLKMINQIRLIKKENEEKQNDIMSEYLRAHPELANGNNNEKFGFWHNYFASEKIMEEKTKPLLAEYDLQLKKQQNLISMFKYVSPAILMQQSLNNIAGTSEKHYNDYKKQVFEFSNTWRNYLVPMLFKNQKFKVTDYNKLPNFTHKNRIKNNAWFNLLAMFITSITILALLTIKDLKNKSLPMNE